MVKPYYIVIPARMASERLPGKPLAELAGRPMLEHVHACAMKASARGVVIATDDERILRAGLKFGAQVVMTSSRHSSGSDRLAECVEAMAWADGEIVVNLQGDEPLMPPECLDQVAALLEEDGQAQAASLYWPIEQAGEIANPNVVKVVTDTSGAALLFSRSVIPHPRAWADVESALAAGVRWKRHIGLYAYRVKTLKWFSRQTPGPLEAAEKLEQLRIIEAGGRIIMAEASRSIPAGVDTAEDLERVRSLIR